MNSDEALRLAVIKQRCEDDHLFFTRYFFRPRHGIKAILNWHHYLMADELEKVITGETQNLCLNVPPGSMKTEMCAINLMARGLALNPRARFLHISYADDLALLNSTTVKEIVELDEFQELWPMALAGDTRAKKRWNVSIDGKKLGGVYAVSLGGQITGFRAGHMVPGFQGAIMMDDPLKPADAYSTPKREAANRALVSTVKSRKALPTTPIVLTMQRLHEMDPTGFIKSGGLPGEWRYVNVPALIDDDYVAQLPEKYRRLVRVAERDEHGRFSYWPEKERLDDMLQMEAGGSMREGQVVNRFTFAAQYQQDPRVMGGDIIKSKYFVRYTALPRMKFRRIYGDTAQKTAEYNDYSVFECWGYGHDGRVYLLDLIRGKWEAPELKRRAVEFWNKHKADNDTGAFLGTLQSMHIEDKASGTGLIQEIQTDGKIPVVPVPREKDKITRVMDVLGYIEAGFVCVPADAPFVSDFISENEAFTANDTHAHDDQIDPMLDCIDDMLGGTSLTKVWESLI